MQHRLSSLATTITVLFVLLLFTNLCVKLKQKVLGGEVTMTSDIANTHIYLHSGTASHMLLQLTGSFVAVESSISLRHDFGEHN